jgi:hypothetical protein
MKTYLIISAPLLSTTAAIAEAFMMGLGSAPARDTWMMRKNSPRRLTITIGGAEGFMSASNLGRIAAGRDSKDLSAVPGLPSSVLWMDSYCSQHPQETFNSAFSDLYETLAETPGSAGLAWALAGGLMYNTPGSDVLELTQVVGTVTKKNRTS